jgi:hypothetical protein
MKYHLVSIPEPRLGFRYGQTMEDPRDGLILFGPLERNEPYGIRYGVVATEVGVRRFSDWVSSVQKPILGAQDASRPFFAGFETVFRTKIRPEPDVVRLVDPEKLKQNLYLADGHQRVYKTVELFERMIIDADDDDEKVDLWFVVIPNEVFQLCRPRSTVSVLRRRQPERPQSIKFARKLKYQKPLFDAKPEIETAKAYEYQVHFHNQLKARLLSRRIATQVIREPTLEIDPPASRGRPAADMRSSVAWNLSTAVYYKASGRPWKLAQVREGVCYVGLVFKKTQDPDPANACCAAQMFLDSGDGVVFKGAVGPWYNEETGHYHLKEQDAADLISTVLQSYRERTGQVPKELFVHGRVRFDDNEWAGFKKAVGDETKIVGVRIQSTNYLKVFRNSDYPLLRGLAYIRDERTAYLWTRGFVPRLGTYPGKEVPNPLLVDVCRGEADIEVVLSDILGLTKLNYNACIYGDGFPVTLRFANQVGEILTAGPTEKVVPLPFRYYI